MYRVLVIGAEAAPKYPGEAWPDPLWAVEKRIREALGNASQAGICGGIEYRFGQRDLMQAARQILADMGQERCQFNLVILVGHGSPGELYFANERRQALPQTPQSYPFIPILDGTAVSYQWMHQIGKHLLAPDGEVYLLGCDFADFDDLPKPLSPGVMVAHRLEVALNQGATRHARKIYFTSGRLAPRRAAAAALNGEGLYMLDDPPEGPASGCLHVARAIPRQHIPGLFSLD